MGTVRRAETALLGVLVVGLGFSISLAQTALGLLALGAANRYVDEQAPWALKKTDPARMATVLYVLAETIRHLAILAQPVRQNALGFEVGMLDRRHGC